MGRGRFDRGTGRSDRQDRRIRGKADVRQVQARRSSAQASGRVAPDSIGLDAKNFPGEGPGQDIGVVSGESWQIAQLRLSARHGRVHRDRNEAMALDSVVTPQVSDQSRDRSSKTDAGEIGLREVLALSWRSRWLVFAITATCTLMAAVAAWLVPKKYDATILLSPVSSQTTSSGLGALGSTVSQLSGLASLVGVNLAGSSGTKAEAVATLQSETLTERYIRDNNLLPTLFSGAWDP